MNLIKFCCRSLLVAAGLVSASPWIHAAPDGPVSYGLIVQMKSTSSAKNREAPQRTRERMTRAFQGKSQSIGTVEASGPNAHWVRWSRPLTPTETQKLIKELEADPNVEWAVPNIREKRLQAVPSDTLYGQQWWLNASSGTSSVPVAGSRGVPNIAAAWATETGTSSTVNVAVLDTGLLRSHPDLQGARFSTGYDMVTNEDGWSNDGDGRDANFEDPGDGVVLNECPSDPDPAASSWHGTRIAGQIGALTDNSMGVAGINRDVRVISVRVASKCGALPTDIVDGMRWAAGLQVGTLPLNAHPARIINISFGGGSTDCRPYQATIDELLSLEPRVLIVASAGNGDDPDPRMSVSVARPARCRGVLAVGAVNRDGFKADYSSLGPEVGITTVGGDTGSPLSDSGILTTDNNGTLAPGANTYLAGSGTSFSAPIVAGVASLMLSMNPGLTLDQLVHGLKSRARPHISTHPSATLPVCQAGMKQGRCYCTTATCGVGVLDAAAAMAYASPPGPFEAAPPFPPPLPAAADSGGGAMESGWLWALLLAVIAVSLSRRREAPAP